MEVTSSTTDSSKLSSGKNSSSKIRSSRKWWNFPRRKKSTTNAASSDQDIDVNVTQADTKVGKQSPVLSTESSHNGDIFCHVCFDEVPQEKCVKLHTCNHQTCMECLVIYLSTEISESRVRL